MVAVWPLNRYRIAVRLCQWARPGAGRQSQPAKWAASLKQHADARGLPLSTRKGPSVLDRGVSGLTPSAIVVFGCVRTEHDYIYVLGPLAEGLAEGKVLVFVFDNHSLGLAPEPGGPTSTRATAPGPEDT